MAFSVAALRASGETVIENAACAAVSCPAYFETLEKLLRR
jgi:5-enolpyruvylshikimate-3-phosphate synthase